MKSTIKKRKRKNPVVSEDEKYGGLVRLTIPAFKRLQKEFSESRTPMMKLASDAILEKYPIEEVA